MRAGRVLTPAVGTTLGHPCRSEWRSSSKMSVAAVSSFGALAALTRVAAPAAKRSRHLRRRVQLTSAAGDAASDGNLSIEQLESRLRDAVEAEDFRKAARLRDQLQQAMLDDEAAVLSVNREFYAAFSNCDGQRMASIWLEEDRTCCVHPGWPPLSGYQAVADSWREILSGRSEMAMECVKPVVVVRNGMGRVVCYEKVNSGGPNAAFLVAVNLFEYTAAGWKMCYHQAGPLQGGMAA